MHISECGPRAEQSISAQIPEAFGSHDCDGADAGSDGDRDEHDLLAPLGVHEGDEGDVHEDNNAEIREPRCATRVPYYVT